MVEIGEGGVVEGSGERRRFIANNNLLNTFI